ncbi:MAG TPA: hypothetical protein VGC65_00330 [Bacteroidia bacterium]|jgi:hypothetical protein
MVIILKHNPKKGFSPIYLVDEGKTTPIGCLSDEAITGILKDKNILEAIDQATFIEQFYFSELLMNEVSKNHYYYLGS